MTYQELRDLVNDIEDDQRNYSVRFGCDCGCGGDSYTIDDWFEMCERADDAQRKLEDFGVIFETDS